MVFLSLLLGACQPKNAPRPSDPVPEAAKVVLIKSQSIEVKLARHEFCDAEGCHRYAMQTVQTNVPWIDDYFFKRLADLEPKAFTSQTEVMVPKVDDQELQLQDHHYFVRYIAQHQHLALFSLQSYSYGNQLTHSLFHQEYVNFDLNLQKRLSLQDVLEKNQQAKLLKLLYEHNQTWLNARHIEVEQLKLSDNFYFAPDALKLVYPVLELGSYADGMTELKIPYSALSGILKAEYMPDLPSYAKPQK